MDALTRSMNVPTVNLGMALGLPAVTETWIKLGVPKDQLHPVPAMLLGALNLTPIEVARAFQTIASGGNRAPLSALRSAKCCIRASRRRNALFRRRRRI